LTKREILRDLSGEKPGISWKDLNFSDLEHKHRRNKIRRRSRTTTSLEGFRPKKRRKKEGSRLFSEAYKCGDRSQRC